MNYYLYRVTNKVNGKIYVGVHKTSRLDDGYMGSGKIIVRAIEKHGIENFEKEILEYFNDAASMFEREKEVVNKEFLERDDVYNLRRGGYGGFDHINSRPDLYLTEKRLAALQPGGIYGTHEEKSLRMKKVHAEGRGSKIFRDPNFQREMCERARKVEKKFSADHQRGEKNSQHGSFWITDGTTSKKCRGDIPEGWSRGRTIAG